MNKQRYVNLLKSKENQLQMELMNLKVLIEQTEKKEELIISDLINKIHFKSFNSNFVLHEEIGKFKISSHNGNDFVPEEISGNIVHVTFNIDTIYLSNKTRLDLFEYIWTNFKPNALFINGEQNFPYYN